MTIFQDAHVYGVYEASFGVVKKSKEVATQFINFQKTV